MGVGRFLCVALPFGLTIGALICMLVAALAGVADKNLYMFRVNTTGLTVNPTELDSLLSRRVDWHSPDLLNNGNSSASSGSNITAVDLGLSLLYDVSLWGYCETLQSGERTCTTPAFSWASGTLNQTVERFRAATASAGQEVVLPGAVTDAMRAFSVVTHWTEVAYVVALVCLGVELFFGIFATCSRAWSCVTFIVASITSVMVATAASLSTAMSVVVVGSVESTAKWYGVRSNFNNTFLAFAWLGVAFALGAGFFWMFTVCCCAPDRSSRRSRRDKTRSAIDSEKPMPTGAYQPLQEPDMAPGYFHNQPQFGRPQGQGAGPRSDMAYEPYSHSRV